ncbi:hypothetical protein IC213_20215 [Clostridioides sp. ES-S-0049-02]|uniref:hypothetical protein n=1 Tax=unclassified Clostridioides TaxID=2635829 RepID=UPI001D0C439C|nr:hypothetical protein [Clostridioides sp. ES-S-0049-02]MCC0764729.1 hypothetical protein [Clostridioides sp. ES-S-0006-03]
MEIRDYISKIELNDMPITLDNEYMLNEINISEYGKIFAVKDTSGKTSYYTEIEFNKRFRGINSILENII